MGFFRPEFTTNSPLEIYGSQQQYTSPMMSVLEHPMAIGADLGASLFVIPSLSDPRKLKNMMGASGYSKLERMTRAYYGIAEASSRDIGAFVRNAPNKAWGGLGHVGRNLEPMSAATHGKAISSNPRLFKQHMVSTFGEGAANRMGMARGLSTATKFVGAYFLAHLGISAIRGVVDMITSYEPPETKTPRHRELETGGMYVDTRSAQTQRARAIQAIHNSQLSTRAALSNEAAFMHFQR